MVELHGRTLESGVYAAVFITADGGELIVDPANLPAAAGQASEVTDPTLAALAVTLRQAPPPPDTPTVTVGPECAAVEDGATIALADQSCVVVRGGGTVTVRGGDAAVTFVTIPREGTVSGAITLALADGAELAREVPPEAPELAAVFDAMR